MMVDPHEPDDHDEDPRGGVLPELTRRLLSAGVGAYFLTEETIRRAVGEARLPRDVANQVVQGAQRRKDDLFNYVKRELGQVIENIDIQGELRRFLQDHNVKVSAEIEFVPKQRPAGGAPAADALDDGEPTPAIEWDVRLRRSGEDAEPTAPPPEEPAGEEA